MGDALILITLALIACAAYFAARTRARRIAHRFPGFQRSLPRHHGYLAAIQTTLLPFLIALAWITFGDNYALARAASDLHALAKDMSAGEYSLLLTQIKIAVYSENATPPSATIAAAAAAFRAEYRFGQWICLAVTVSLALVLFYRSYTINSDYDDARDRFETILKRLLLLTSLLAILITLGIVLSLLFESLLFFRSVSLSDFLFGTTWSPQTALRDDQIVASGSFGALPLIAGTLLIAAVAVAVAAPIGLMSAIYLSQYARPATRAFVKPLLEVLAGIPTVVYGFFAAATLAPFLMRVGGLLGLSVASESALAAGIVMGVMIIPFISSLSDDALNAVPTDLSNAALALGATKSEAILKVVAPAASHGIISAILLAVSRAVGETMIVVMAAGMRPTLTANPLEAVTTVTVQIVSLLTGDQEFDSPKTLSAFALGLTLFVLTLIFNLFAIRVFRRPAVTYD